MGRQLVQKALEVMALRDGHKVVCLAGGWAENRILYS